MYYLSFSGIFRYKGRKRTRQDKPTEEGEDTERQTLEGEMAINSNGTNGEEKHEATGYWLDRSDEWWRAIVRKISIQAPLGQAFLHRLH